MLAAVSLSAGTAGAEIYSYVAADGTRHYTNVPTDPHFRLLARPTRRPSPADARRRAQRIDRLIMRAADQYDVDPAFIRAVIKVESDFDPTAISPAGARGLMQLMPPTAARFNVVNPFNPEQNIDGGVRYLAELLDRFDQNLPFALAAYHAGESAVDSARGIPPIPATQAYVRRVLSHYDRYRGPALNRAVYRIERPGGEVVFSNTLQGYTGAKISLLRSE